jgi:hypothetical protein
MRLLPILALLSLAPAAAAAGLCDDPAPWPAGPEAAVTFEALPALEPGRAGDGPNPPEPVELTGDVLGIGQAPAAPDTGLAVAEVVCVRQRPEWLGLMIRNAGGEDAPGRLALTLPGGRLLEAPLPPVPAGGERRFLVRAGDPLTQAAVRLEVRPGD